MQHRMRRQDGNGYTASPPVEPAMQIVQDAAAPPHGELAELRRKAYGLHLQHVITGVLQGEKVLQKQMIAAVCPTCKQEIAAFFGYDFSYRARFNHKSVDVVWNCAGPDDAPHEPIELSLRTYFAAQQDAASLLSPT